MYTWRRALLPPDCCGRLDLVTLLNFPAARGYGPSGVSHLLIPALFGDLNFIFQNGNREIVVIIGLCLSGKFGKVLVGTGERGREVEWRVIFSVLIHPGRYCAGSVLRPSPPSGYPLQDFIKV